MRWYLWHVIVMFGLTFYLVLFGSLTLWEWPLYSLGNSLLYLPLTAIGVFIYRRVQRRKQKAPTHVPDV